MNAAELAQRFHEAYERLAPRYGYKAAAIAWKHLPEHQRALMTSVCEEILRNMKTPCLHCKELVDSRDTTCGYCVPCWESLREEGGRRSSDDVAEYEEADDKGAD